VEPTVPERALGPRPLGVATSGSLPKSTTSWDPPNIEQAGPVEDHRINLLEIVLLFFLPGK